MRPKFGSKIRGAKTLVAYSFCSLWTVLQVSLNKGPGRVGLFTNVFNMRVPVDGLVDCYA
jgi:hypothetical protein